MNIIYTVIIVLVLVLLVILPMFIKIIFLNRTIKSMKQGKKNLIIKHNKVIEDRKIWEDELSFMVKRLFGNIIIDFNSDLYLGTLLAYQRGYRIPGLEDWLHNPIKDSDIYKRIFNILMEEIPKRDELIGYNTFDNMARILMENQYPKQNAYLDQW